MKRKKNITKLQELSNFYDNDPIYQENVDTSIFDDVDEFNLKSEREILRKDKSFKLLPKNQQTHMIESFNELESLIEKNPYNEDALKFSEDKTDFFEGLTSSDSDESSSSEENEDEDEDEDDVKEFKFFSKIPQSHSHIYVVPPTNNFFTKKLKGEKRKLNGLLFRYCILKDIYSIEISKVVSFIDFENFILPNYYDLINKKIKISGLLMKISKANSDLEFSWIHQLTSNNDEFLNWNFCFKLDNGEKEIFYLCLIFNLDKDSKNNKMNFTKLKNSSNNEEFLFLNDKLLNEEKIKENIQEIEKLYGTFEGFFYYTCDCKF